MSVTSELIVRSIDELPPEGGRVYRSKYDAVLGEMAVGGCLEINVTRQALKQATLRFRAKNPGWLFKVRASRRGFARIWRVQ
jgi:hypothetical protein